MNAVTTTTRPPKPRAWPRLVAQLWGTTTLGDDLAALSYLARPRLLVKGPAIRAYEQAFAREVGVRYAYSFSSGRVAMYAILCALNIGAGDEVLLQAPTHIVVANAIRYTGAKPVFVDCRLDNFNMDLEQAEQRLTPHSKVLLVQHTFGVPVEMDQALDLAKRHHLIVLEDCVHALGASYRGKMIGSFGKAAFFSTEETKIISSTMGGMAVTDDPELAARLEAFQKSCPWPERAVTARYLWKFIVYHLFTHPRLHPLTRPIYMKLRQNPRTHMAPGATGGSERHGERPAIYEMRLSNSQAALALRQLKRLKSNLASRRAHAAAYAAGLAQVGYATPRIPPGAEPSYVRFPILVEQREKAERAAGPYVVMGHWFDTVLEESAAPEYGQYVHGSCPNAEAAAQHLLNLPTHGRLTADDIERVIPALAGLSWHPGQPAGGPG